MVAVRPNWYTEDGWHHLTDPYEVLPVGFTSRRIGGEILGFCSPMGQNINRLMVVVTRDTYSGLSYSTMNYLDVLNAYLKHNQDG